MSTHSPRQRRHLQTKEAILAAARRIIREQGAGGLSMRAIAEQIDYSPAGLYEYFGSKEEIIIAICQEGEQRLRAALAAPPADQSPAEHLIAIGKAYIAFAMANPQHYLLMFNTVSLGGALDEVGAEASSFGILLAAIQRGIEAGAFKARPGFGQWEMAYAAWSLVHGIAMLRLTFLSGASLDFETSDEQALRTFVSGLTG